MACCQEAKDAVKNLVTSLIAMRDRVSPEDQKSVDQAVKVILQFTEPMNMPRPDPGPLQRELQNMLVSIQMVGQGRQQLTGRDLEAWWRLIQKVQMVMAPVVEPQL